MKKITFFFLMLTVSLGYAQVNLEDFEGTAPTTTNDQNIANSVEPNPDTVNAVNTSATALQLITTTAGEPWQGTKLLMQNNKIDMTTADKTMTVDVYSATPIEFLFKLSNGDANPEGTDPALESKTAMAHTGSGWETLTLDFNNAADTTQPGYNPPNDQFSSIVFFPLYNIANNGWNSSAVTTTYVDNITAVEGDAIVVDPCTNGVMDGDETGIDCGGSCPDACPSPPTVAAPTPPARPAADVISLYSDAYTDVASNFDAAWCGANSIEEVMIAGNATLAWKSNPCQGIVLDAGIDATTFTNLHVDLYIQAGTDLTSKVFNLKFVQQPGGAALEINLNAASTPALVAGTWLSVDVPVDLSTFTGFKEFGVTSANLNNIAWYDNLYVHKNTVLGTDEFESSNFKVYPNPTKDNWNIESNTTISSVTVFDILGKQVMALTTNSNDVEINTSTIKTGIYFARIEGVNGSKTVKLIKE
jgi:hypothetical protein